MKLIKESLQRLAYDYSGAKLVKCDGYSYHTFNDDYIYNIVPYHITLSFVYFEIDSNDVYIESLSDQCLAINLGDYAV